MKLPSPSARHSPLSRFQAAALQFVEDGRAAKLRSHQLLLGAGRSGGDDGNDGDGNDADGTGDGNNGDGAAVAAAAAAAGGAEGDEEEKSEVAVAASMETVAAAPPPTWRCGVCRLDNPGAVEKARRVRSLRKKIVFGRCFYASGARAGVCACACVTLLCYILCFWGVRAMCNVRVRVRVRVVLCACVQVVPELWVGEPGVGGPQPAASP